MSRFWGAAKVLTGTLQGSTSKVASAPICLQPRRKALSNTVQVVVPGCGANLDLESLTANVIVTGQAGTSPTLLTTIEGTHDFMDNSTTIVTTALTSSATTINLTLRDGIPQYGYALIYAVDGSAYEWVQVTSSATTGTGVHTIVRGALNTTGTAFAVGALVFFTNSWKAIPTNDATTTTMTTAAVDISGASAAVSVIDNTIDTQRLDMNKIPFPFIRVTTTVGGSSTPTATYAVSLSGLIRATDGVRAR